MGGRELGFAPGVPQTVVVTCLVTLALQPISHMISNALFEGYRQQPFKQTEWNTRVVSTAHAVLVSVLSAWVMAKEGWPVMFTDMAYESPLSAHTVAITSGYLVGDLILVLLSLKPWGKGNISSPVDTCIHHVIGAMSFMACLYCRCSYVYSLIFIFTESSTPFVNLRWFLHESHMASSAIYTVNGVLMVLSFFLARIFMLPFQWYIVLSNLKQTTELGTIYLSIQATSGMAAVTCLNLLWFSKMIKGLLKMLRGGRKAKKEGEGGNTQPAAARRTSPRTSKKGV